MHCKSFLNFGGKNGNVFVYYRFENFTPGQLMTLLVLNNWAQTISNKYCVRKVCHM